MPWLGLAGAAGAGAGAAGAATAAGAGAATLGGTAAGLGAAGGTAGALGGAALGTGVTGATGALGAGVGSLGAGSGALAGGAGTAGALGGLGGSGTILGGSAGAIPSMATVPTTLATPTLATGGALSGAAPTAWEGIMSKLPQNFEEAQKMYKQFEQIKDLVGPGKSSGAPGQQGSPAQIRQPQQPGMGSSAEGLPPAIRAALLKFLR